MYVKINVLYVHCTAYILHILDLARALVFNTAHSTPRIYNIYARCAIYAICTLYIAHTAHLFLHTFCIYNEV